MSRAAAHPGLWNVLLSQGFGPSSGDPLNPYASMGGAGMTPPPKRSSPWPWILGIGGGFLLAGLLCCGCFGGFIWFGVGQMTEMVKQQISDDPVVREHLGEVQSVTTNMMAIGEEQQKNPPAPGQNVLVFDVVGTKGSGQLVGTQLPAPGPGRFLTNMKLRKDGKEYPLAD